KWWLDRVGGAAPQVGPGTLLCRYPRRVVNGQKRVGGTSAAIEGIARQTAERRADPRRGPGCLRGGQATDRDGGSPAGRPHRHLSSRVHVERVYAGFPRPISDGKEVRRSARLLFRRLDQLTQQRPAVYRRRGGRVRD